jgi:phosphatidylglycerophosphatase C
MPTPRPPPGTPCIALFDLDGTLTWGDTLMIFLAGYLLRHPLRCLRLWRLPLVVFDYAFRTRDRGVLKGGVIRTVMGGDSRARIDAWADSFVAGLHARGAFRPAALRVLEEHRAAGDQLVLLSASPDLYVPRIGRLLGFDRTICTGIRWQRSTADSDRDSPADRLDGALATPNRRGEEKSSCLAWLRSQLPGMPVMAYGNSASDLPHMKLADGALLVNAAGAARRQAATLGLTVASWS